ncbi:hypothetical protein FDC50_09975 [Clostridium botulinum]|nr:hypothetical protein KU40_14900 [Clostridium botulinum]KFX56180.1 hypothetical protein KU41_17665 [Clostridium botulinum]MBY6778496.1 hypothetical protein [Clostridium botulinum]MBY6804391.1 hypothetical protein [Clostridium botulinum]MBY6813354.1 hypothetical protein [Clostridium botulinum]
MKPDNGDNINKYIKETMKKYKSDKTIFDKTMNILNIYMQRKDWPICYNEFIDISKDLLGADVENLFLDFEVFKILKSVSNEYELELEDFKKDISLFFKVFYSIMDEYYSYRDNPIGLKKIMKLNIVNDKQTFRVIRNDGEHFDLLISKEEMKKIISTLDEISKEQ